MSTREYLQSQWSGLMKSVNADATKARKCFEDIIEQYSDSNRSYHTEEHIFALLKQAELLKWHDPVSVKLAIFYHDFIYGQSSAGKGSDERRSAETALFDLGALGFEFETASRVAALIMMTEPPRAKPKKDPDAALFLDIDMSILGSRPEIYKGYAWQVRQEYAQYDETTFCQGRMQFLKGELDKGTSFLTKKFQDSHGPQAHVNMRTEFSYLKEAGTPYGKPPARYINDPRLA